MLTQLVRPMVQTQLRLLANSRATRSTLVSTVSQWLGFLGVRAQVTQLDSGADKIQISLTVDKPEACDPKDWQQILHNLHQAESEADLLSTTAAKFTPQQQSKMNRLLAYLIQIGNPGEPIDWDALYPQLQSIGLDELTLMGIRSALKVPQSLEDLVEGLDSDVAAVALPKAVSIAMLDKRVNSSEDLALSTLLKAMREQQEATAS
ncbi:hypothetical protein J5X98_02005 [Leptothermofonsia sichuanensis E412]|uniref:hypothetical protein n=1 Tax=Leptothermofonsia sichuanensis TaxID=2917832 RepID=UPI001CA6361E|nr:hypothetical protein [Leptothermofonsia sichuanensis]QZZ21287.1 hypothetical protein J5X98_02005 [Leptothermofonsia sichuanensis E412]